MKVTTKADVTPMSAHVEIKVEIDEAGHYGRAQPLVGLTEKAIAESRKTVVGMIEAKRGKAT